MEERIKTNYPHNNDYENNIALGFYFPIFKNSLIINGKKHYTQECITLLDNNKKARILKFVRKTNKIIFYCYTKEGIITYGKTTKDNIIFENNDIKKIDFNNEDTNHLFFISLIAKE